jgi:hypothetical protein
MKLAEIRRPPPPRTVQLRGVGPVLHCGACDARLTLRPVDDRWGCENVCCRWFLDPATPTAPERSDRE